MDGAIVDITSISGLRGVEAGPDGVRIGAATTWSDIVLADLPGAFDGLKAAARTVGAIQVQNAGTVGGNLCNASPAADGVPPLLTLDAEVILVSLSGERRLRLREFLQGPRQTALEPGEILAAVHIPRSSVSGQGAFEKLGARAYLVISIAMVAVRVEWEAGLIRDAAVAVGSCSAVARRLTEIEAGLIGTTGAVSDEMVASALDPIDDVRADAAYRAHAASVMIRKAVAATNPVERRS